MKLALGSDHGGYRLKEEVKKLLEGRSIEYRDFGTFSTEPVDYPDYALAVSEAVASGEFGMGIICCGTGLGVSIAANKVPGIRAAVCHEPYSARMTREHNDANVLTLGERVTGIGLALETVTAFLDTPFAGGRHTVRVEKICEIENKYYGGTKS